MFNNNEPIIPLDEDILARQLAIAKECTPIINEYITSDDDMKSIVEHRGLTVNKFNGRTPKVYMLRSSGIMQVIGRNNVLSRPVIKSFDIKHTDLTLKRPTTSGTKYTRFKDLVRYNPYISAIKPKGICSLTKGVIELYSATLHIETQYGQFDVELDDFSMWRTSARISGEKTIDTPIGTFTILGRARVNSVFDHKIPCNGIDVRITSDDGNVVKYDDLVDVVTISLHYKLHQIQQHAVSIKE